MQNCSPLLTFSRRYASTVRRSNVPNYKKFNKYKNKYEEKSENRTAVQRLRNTAQGRFPFDKRFVVTGKDVGPGVLGGSVEAQERVAMHVVQPNGYIKKSGQFIRIKEMEPEFVVPDLKDCKVMLERWQEDLLVCGVSSRYFNPYHANHDKGAFATSVAPDQTLKPYVSYKATDINQSKFTAKDLFDSCYAPDMIEEFKLKKEGMEEKKSVFSKLFGKKQDADSKKKDVS